ncbi:MAG: hypothetical protein GY906_14600, partial [bacterium]|nr:hypothetical protein [bacterium]
MESPAASYTQAMRLLFISLVAAVSVLPGFAVAELPTVSDCSVINIHAIGAEALDELKTDSGIDWWLELDSEMLVCGEGAIAGISENYNPLKFYPQLDAGGLYVTRG